MNLRLLDHPLDSKSLRPFDSSGVYVFISNSRSDVEKKLSSECNVLAALSESCEVLYVGKAKQLNQRLQNYRRAGSSSAGEWYKSTKLMERARCVLLIPTATHFEACLLELFLIRILVPELNYTSTGAGRIHFVLQDRVSRRLSVSSRKKAGMKVWGVVRARSQVRLAFDALSEGFESYRQESDEVLVQPFYSRFGRTLNSGRLIVDITSQHEEICRKYLRGQRNALMSALWSSMKKAADGQQFHLAAQMRDRYLALRELQLQLKRSRRLLRSFRNVSLEMSAQDEIPARVFIVERFVIKDLQLRWNSRATLSEPAYVLILKDAIEQFKVQLDCESEIERLRVNFEFLRLMLWWHSKQSETCSTK